MILRLDIERLRTVDELRDFMAGSEPVDFHLTDRRTAPYPAYPALSWPHPHRRQHPRRSPTEPAAKPPMSTTRRRLVLVDGSPYLYEIAHTIARIIGTFVNRGRFGSFERG